MHSTYFPCFPWLRMAWKRRPARDSSSASSDPPSNIFERGDLCENCSQIDWELLRTPTLDQLSESSTPAWRNIPHLYLRNIHGDEKCMHWHIGSVAAIEQRASQCALCSILSDMRRNLHSFEALHNIRDSSICKAYLTALGRRPGFNGHNQNVPSGLLAFSLGFSWSDPSDPNDEYEISNWLTACNDRGQGQLTTASGSGSGELALKQQMVPKKFSLEKISQWIEKCTEGHEECKKHVHKEAV